MEFKISKEQSGLSVLSFLKSTLKISRHALSSLKRVNMGICANGEHVTVRYVLKEGDILTISESDTFEDTNESISPQNLPINILFENESFIIIDKPANMPTHPSHNHAEDTLANALAYIYDQRGEALVFRPIGRLDRNTSGLSLIAKNSISAPFLHYARSKGMITKRYLAILEGQIAQDNEWHETTMYMKRMDNSIIIRSVTDASDKDAFIAITRWRMLYSNSRICLVEAIPETGRTHQLRVNFAHLGFPILGDDIYGAESEYISRHALHAYSLALPIPYDGEIRVFSSLPPDDMHTAFKRLSGIELIDIIQKAERNDNG